MRQKGFTNIISIAGVIVLVGIAGYFLMTWRILLPVPFPNLTPASHPIDCIADFQCPSAQYICEATQEEGIISPVDDTSQAFAITKGICKSKEGGACTEDAHCAGGLLCHSGICTNPIGRDCAGPKDKSCPADYRCIQKCGPPVVREDDTSSPGYSCQLEGYLKICPICLAENTLIDTPAGAMAVQNLQKGMEVWTVDILGKRVAEHILQTSRTPVPATHEVVRIMLEDGRELFVSPGHPTSDGRTMGELRKGEQLDNSSIVRLQRISYQKKYTYDILPSGETGFYWANGILVKSTLSVQK
ncbi:MAG: Hint domain-containing protein [Candidatus Sungbacteria bacterium]|nr:Hint domain-containing protein [Candidatus Sungbacteria bacterium]